VAISGGRASHGSTAEEAGAADGVGVDGGDAISAHAANSSAIAKPHGANTCMIELRVKGVMELGVSKSKNFASKAPLARAVHGLPVYDAIAAPYNTPCRFFKKH